MKSVHKNYYFFKDPTKLNEEHLIVSDGMGHVTSRNYLTNREFINNNIVMFVISGTLYVEQFGKKYTVEKNHGVLMKLTHQHKYYSDKNDSINMIWFHFRGKNCEYFVDKLMDSELLPFVFNSDIMESTIYRLFDLTINKDLGYEIDISRIIYYAVMEIMKDKLGEMQALSASLRDVFVNKVDNYIDINLYNNITLDELSKNMNLSKYYFCRIFKTYFNTTPIKYVLFKKIDHSKNLLIYTNDKIESISSKLGFVDISHFSRYFKLFVGVKPSIFRKSKAL